MKPVPPQAHESAKALAEVEENDRIRRITPLRDEFLAALGRDSLARHADGSWSIRVTDERWPAEKNRRRLAIVNEMMRARREAQTNRTHRRAMERNDVRFIDAGGNERMVPDYLGEHVEKKGMRWKMAHRKTARLVFAPQGDA